MKKIRSKILLKLLLAVAFAVTLIAGLFAFNGTAYAAEESPILPDTHAHTTAYTDGVMTEGSYYLTDDFTGKFTVTGEVTLCLNGNTISGIGDGSIITVSENASFTLCDCVGTGCITGANASIGSVCVNGTFIMNSGKISGNTAMRGGGVYVDGTFIMENGEISGNEAYNHNTSCSGGGVYVDGGSFTMKNGKISGNTADGSGGGVYVYGGSFTMENGEINDNTAMRGGGVCVDNNTLTMNSGTFIMKNGEIKGNDVVTGGGVFVAKSCTFTMTGGEICGNEAFDEDLAARGGGVYVAYEGTFAMENGTITDNTAKEGGGVFVWDSGNVSVSGTPNITGNKLKDESVNNVDLMGVAIAVAEELTEGAQIGIYSTGAVATGFTQDGEPSEFFIPDDPANDCIYASGGTVNIGTHTILDVVSDNVQEATCIQAGSYDEVICCSDCKQELNRTQKTIDVNPDAHSFGQWQAEVAANCTETGIKGHKDCSLCHKHFDSENVEITDLIIAINENHNWGEWQVVTEATETEEGEERRVCARNDTHFETRTMPYVAPEDSGKLSAGAIAGIVIGSFILLLLIVYVVCYFALYRRGVLLKGKLFDAIYVPMNAIFGKKKQDSETENS